MNNGLHKKFLMKGERSGDTSTAPRIIGNKKQPLPY